MNTAMRNAAELWNPADQAVQTDLRVEAARAGQGGDLLEKADLTGQTDRREKTDQAGKTDLREAADRAGQEDRRMSGKAGSGKTGDGKTGDGKAGDGKAEDRSAAADSGHKAGRYLLREQEYCEALREELKRRGGTAADISFLVVRKNNGVRKNACTIRFNDAQVAPTVYLDPYYDHYLHGEAVGESAENILRFCRSRTPDVTFPENFFRDYDTVRGRLGIKLIGSGRNRMFLRDVPHVEIEDLSAVFFYLLENPAFGNGMIIIRNSDMERWGKTTQDLYRDALENCPVMLPPVFRALSDVLQVLQPSPEGELYLLTNESAMFGAAVILYPGLLQEVADYLRTGFFVLPSSVHEVILLPDKVEEPFGLLQIVTEINHTQVAEEEVLADAVYHFTPGDTSIRKVL